MITCYFGVPGVGKNTFGTMVAQTVLRKIEKGKSPYKYVFTDFWCEGCSQIEFKNLEKYLIKDALIIFEELGLDADNREFKNFSKDIRDFFILARHLGVDIVYCTQDYSNVDKKIRDLTQELWYLERSCVPILSEFTVAQRIFRTIAINENTNELCVGYRFPNLIERLFTKTHKICYRRPWYKYFDSYDCSRLEGRPYLEPKEWKPFSIEDLQVLEQNPNDLVPTDIVKF